jgi:hypothetical protein
MEAIWTFPLYIICPLIGIILTLIGILKIRKGNTNKTLYIGLSLLALPLIQLTLVSIFHINLENKIVGVYNLKNEKDVLIIYENETFAMNKSSQFNDIGKGKWKIQEIDFPILILDFNSTNKSELWLEIEQNEEQIILKPMSGNNSLNEFVKK